MNPVSAAQTAVPLETRALAMTLSDARATLANVQAAQARADAQPADVVLELSTAAQQLLDS